MRFKLRIPGFRRGRSTAESEPAEPGREPADDDELSSAHPDCPAAEFGPESELRPPAAHGLSVPGAPVAPVIVPRWVQLVLLPLGLLGLWALARASGSVLLVLIVASMVALILNPVVQLFERRMPRGLAIACVYLGSLAALAGVVVLLANPVSTQLTNFSNNVPQIVKHANHDLSNLQQWLTRNGINIRVQKQGQTALDTLQKDVLKRSGAVVAFSRDLLGQIVALSFALVLILVLSIYLLAYGRQIGDLARRVMPTGDGTPEDDYPTLVQRAVSGYVRGQCTFSFVMGVSAIIALTIFGLLGIFPDGEHYALFFGIFYGLMEFIPYIGPIIGPAPAVIVALFDNPITAVWVVLLFIGLQQLEGHVVAPQVFRISLRINPILIILGLLIGFQLYGIPGSLVALPALSVIRATVLYLRRHLVLEPWAVAGPGAGLIALDPQRCPDCGAAGSEEDTFCRNCGASLTPRVRTPSGAPH